MPSFSSRLEQGQFARLTRLHLVLFVPVSVLFHLFVSKGWFGEEKNIEEILAAKGQNVTTITDADIDYHP